MKSHYFVQSFAGVSMPEPFLKASDLFVGITYGGVVELYLQTQLQLDSRSKPNWFSNETKLGFALLLTRGQQGNLQIFKPHVQSHYFT